MPRWLRFVGDRAVQWWWLDVPAAAAVVLVVAFATPPGAGPDVLGRLDLATRRSVYGDLTQLASLFGGLSGIAFTVYLSLGSSGIERIKKMVGTRLLRMWLAALATPWVVALTLVIAKVVDRGGRESPNMARAVAAAAVLVLVLSLGRLIWIFYNLAAIDLRGDVAARPTTDRPIEVVGRKRA